MNSVIIVLIRLKILKTNLSPLMIDLQQLDCFFTVPNGLAVSLKDYKTPPPSHIPTLSRGGGGSE
jgi:hypothetical protein